MGRKQDFEQAARTSRALRSSIGDFRTTYAPAAMADVTEYRGRLGSLSGETREQYSPLKSQLLGMMTDESKRGYSPEALSGMYGRAAGALSGARRTGMEQLSRNVAAAGMGRTGVGLRAALNYDKDYARQQREAARDVNIQAEEAKRSDLWNAISGYGTAVGSEQGALRDIMGLEQGALGLNQQTLNQILQSYGLETGALQTEGNLLEGKHTYAPGFWGRLGLGLAGSAVSGFGGGLGSGYASRMPGIKKG